MHARALWVAFASTAGAGALAAACLGDPPPDTPADGGLANDGDVTGDSPANGDAAGCPVDQTSCSGTCVDLKTSATDCGKCGKTCFGGTCAASACSPYEVARQPTTGSVAKLATDGTRVLWADTGKVAIEQIAAGGGTSITLAAANATSGSTADVLALGSGTVAFVYLGGSGPAGVGIAHVDQANSGIQVNTVVNAITAVTISKSASHIFYVDKPGTEASLMDCKLSAAGDAGPCVSPANGNFGEELAADDANIFYNLSGSEGPQTGLYLDRFDTALGGSNPLIFSPRNTSTLAVDGTWAYWTESPDGGAQLGIRRTLESAPGSAQTVVSAVASPEFATDGANVYYWNGTSIASRPVAGGSEATLAPAANFAQIAVGGGLLVWTDGATINGIVLP